MLQQSIFSSPFRVIVLLEKIITQYYKQYYISMWNVVHLQHIATYF